MKLTFKNVGQGDSIILEWLSNGKSKIGLIDCNKSGGSNPVLNYLQSKMPSSIEFAILSHPHFDHFSGFNEIFKWCINNQIPIKYFFHTSQQTPEFILTALETSTARDSAARLFQSIRKLRNNLNTQIYIIDDNPHTNINLGEEWKMKFLSPSSIEYDNFAKKINTFSREENFNNNTNGNWLSTIIKLSNSKNAILLTSDAEKQSFSRIKKNKEVLNKFILAQAPHHGSKKNHNITFWQMLRKVSKCPIAISVGENKYNHPSEYVIQNFNKLQFSVHRTDNSNNNKLDYSTIFTALDQVSELVTDSKNQGKDLIFSF